MNLKKKSWICVGSVVALILANPMVSSAQYFSQVQVQGNQFLRGDDILAACGITPDQSFSDPAVSAMRDCLMSTGQFRKVDFAPEGDTMNVVVEELNTRPGRAEVGLKYDSEAGPIGTIYFERYNLFPNTFGALELTFSDEHYGMDASLYRKDAFAGGWDAGIDLHVSESNFGDQNFTHRRATIEPFLARQIDDQNRIEIGLGYRSDVIRDVSFLASPHIVAEAGSRRAAYLRLSYAFEADGWGFSAKQFFFGLGSGDVVSQTQLEAEKTFQLMQDDLALTFSAKGGHSASLKGEAPRITDRFLIGGSELRGFAPRGVGVRSGADNLGGESFVVLSAELKKDIGDLFGTKAQVGGFVDVGSAWGLTNTLGGAIDDSFEWRSAVGISLTLEIGRVPVSLYIAEPISKEPGDKEQNFGIAISTRF